MSQPFEPISPDSPDDETSEPSSSECPVPCYFMVVDILGFSSIIENLNAEEQTQRISVWIDLVETTRRLSGVEEIQLISDTLFVREENSVDGLLRLLTFAQLLLEKGIQNSLPLRGAVVHGEAAWGRLTYGKAVIQAHQVERSLDWIGIACAPNLPGLDSMWRWDLIVVYPVPSKSGLTQLVPAVSWKVPSTTELIRGVMGNGLLSDGDPIRWEIVSKIERTIQFGMYLSIGRANRLDPKYYRGWFPMHILEEFHKAGV